MAFPMNTSPQIEQYQHNNQPQPELSTIYLDASWQIYLILSVLWFGPFGFVVMIASTSPFSPIEQHRRNM
jgi:hypothetical protein